MLITGAWQKKIESYLEVGAYLIDAKAKLPGEYEAMIESDLPFDKSTARRLKIIAEHPILSDRAYTHALPARWMTLYLLSQLPPETLVALIEDGTVSPKLQQKDAIALLPSRSGATTGSARSDDEESLDGICAFCVEAASAVRPTQWNLEAENDQPASGTLIDDLAEQVKRILAPPPRRQRSWRRRSSWRRSARPEPKPNLHDKIWRLIKLGDRLHPDYRNQLSDALRDLASRAAMMAVRLDESEQERAARQRANEERREREWQERERARQERERERQEHWARLCAEEEDDEEEDDEAEPEQDEAEDEKEEEADEAEDEESEDETEEAEVGQDQPAPPPPRRRMREPRATVRARKPRPTAKRAKRGAA
jgi:hypothetical protein